MERIKLFIEKFLDLEAEVTSCKRVPNLDAYHQKLQEYYTFLVEQLQGATGHMPIKELYSEEYYEKMKKYPADTPRKVFKISEYDSPKYEKVWVVFVSQRNYNETYKHLESALFVIQTENSLKVAKFLMFNDYTENADEDTPFEWDDLGGYKDLDFNNLKHPIRINRYIAPNDWLPGLEQYNRDI